MKEKIAEWINVIFGFRKFIAWFGLFLVGIIFRVQGLIDGPAFVDLMKSTFMGFVAANGVEHIMTTVQGVMNSKNAAQSAAVASGADDGKDDDKEVVPAVET
jgi:hypothetical protein